MAEGLWIYDLVSVNIINIQKTAFSLCVDDFEMKLFLHDMYSFSLNVLLLEYYATKNCVLFFEGFLYFCEPKLHSFILHNNNTVSLSNIQHIEEG